jgi:chromatin remodeling complex protein RSC6
MVRASKSDKQTASAAAPVAVTPSPVVTETVASAPVEAAAAKKTRKPKAAPVEAAAPVVTETVAPVSTENVVAETAAAVEPVDASVLALKLNEFGASLVAALSAVSTLKNEFKVLEKAVARELKNAQKSKKGKRNANRNRQPSGFVKPTKISDELAAFLGKPIGSEMARTEVSTEINKYIRGNNLQDGGNGRIIHPDAKLSALLKISSADEQLTYFNLQRYMKHHFIKNTVVA